MIIHTVRPGDSLYKIAQQYDVPPNTIAEANRLPNPDALVVGQAVVIPGNFFTHTVRSGQTLFSIARSYGIPLQALLEANPGLSDASRLSVGQTVIIPLPPEKMRAIYVNGFAFPSIDPGVLQSTLPYLSFLSLFSYQVRPDGSLKPIDDTRAVQTARSAGVAPLMTITNIEEGDGFDSELARSLLSDRQTQEVLLNNIVAVLQEKGYAGLVVDFEYIYPEDRQNYSNFISRTVSKLRPLGYQTAVAVAPKLSAGQTGLLYEAHDYPSLGALADFIILMTYEWGYLYGPAMAVAPLNQVRKVLDYATGVIPPEKILMGMPNYGYDWTLPFVRGSAARVLTNYGAVTLAQRVGANIRFDPVSQAPYFNYYDQDGKRHEVWFDDARSYAARLRLVDQYDLGGVSYWTLNSFFAPNWLVLDSMYNVRKLS